MSLDISRRQCTQGRFPWGITGSVQHERHDEPIPDLLIVVVPHFPYPATTINALFGEVLGVKEPWDDADLCRDCSVLPNLGSSVRTFAHIGVRGTTTRMRSPLSREVDG